MRNMPSQIMEFYLRLRPTTLDITAQRRLSVVYVPDGVQVLAIILVIITEPYPEALRCALGENRIAGTSLAVEKFRTPVDCGRQPYKKNSPKGKRPRNRNLAVRQTS